MTIRDIDRRLRNLDSSDTTTPTPLTDSLVENATFNYAHLVKFERPTATSIKGKTSRKANIYSYITDSAFDIEWDDLSIDASGVANGTQNYHANKISKVGSVTETTEAKSTSMSLSLDASSLGASATSLGLWLSATEIHAAVGIDLREEGFREGDKIHITTSNGNINTGGGIYVIIDTFKSNGNHITYTLAQTASITTGTATGSYKISLAAEEINALVISKDSTSYNTYLNREVFIYKAHLNSDTNAVIGDPYLLFKGIISNGQIKESPDKSSTVTWGLSSHWGDFQRVAGRLTIDESHRALDGAGNSDANNTLRPEYAGDLGFAHANQALNVMALYNDVEISYKQVDINGGWFGGKRLKEVETVVQKRVDLSFNLSPKYLPVIYGVQKTDAIPIFVDTDNNNASKLTVVYAICEGPISGLLDIYIDGNSSICVDKADFDLRSTASPAVDLVCRGRMDRGDTFGGYGQTNSTITIMGGSYQLWYAFGGDFGAAVEAFQQSEYYQTNIQSTPTAVDADTGMLHEQTHTITSPLTANFQIHVGKPDQQANPRLVAKAAANGFKIQNNYYTDTDPYWGAQHRLLDTAYVVGEFTIAEGETSVPELDFVVRGKGVKCYNYDRSYNQNNTTSAASSQFNLGDTVALRKLSDDGNIATSVTIIDKWDLIDPEGVSQTRFITDHNADITEAHYMEKTGGHKWYMSPENTEGQVEGTVAAECKTIISSSSPNSSAGGVNIVVAASTPFSSAYALAVAAGGAAANITLSGSSRLGLRASTFNNIPFANNTFTGVGVGINPNFVLNGSITEVHMKNGIVLASGDRKADNFYTGYKIVLKHFDADGVPNIQERDIIGYANGGNVAIVSSPWDHAYLPNIHSKYFISDYKTDLRVSINPALQLLDYLTSPIYGRGLDLEEDIDLQSFLQSARLCDTRSTVSVAVLATQISDDAVGVYQYAPSGVVHFRGTIQSITSVSAGSAGTTAYKEVVFSNVIGKLGHRDNNWKTRRVGELVWNPLNGKLYTTTGTGVYTISGNTGLTTSFSLAKVSGTGPTALALDLIAPTTHYNPLVKSWKATVGDKGRFEGSGYALYDSDDVKYWKYLGWDKHEQRNVTRHQMNQIVATSSPIFDNINNMLKQFNGILRYSNGKYQLDIKGQAPDIFVVGEVINEDDIIGDISLKDAGIKKSYNSISTSIKDPATKFESRSVSFFNSTYLNEDKFIPKKGTFGMPGITNYFNARYNINQMLDESRYGLSVSFKMMPKGLLLLPGSIIRLNYPRFGWVNKEFRISSHITQSDCLVSITADEHNNSAYLIKNVSKPTVGSEIETGSIQNKNNPTAPTSFVSTSAKGAVKLTWTNSSQFDPEQHITEIWRHTSATPFSSAKLIAETTAEEWQAVEGNTASTTRYYWIRHSSLVRSTLASIDSRRRNNSSLVGATPGTSPIDETLSGKAGVLAPVVDGANGASTNWVFKRVTAKPATPTANGFNVPSGWSDTTPSGTNTLWASKGFAAVGSSAYAWEAVFQIEASVVAELKVYSDVVASNGSSPSKPSNGTSTFNGTTGILTINNSSWNLSPPSITTNGDTVYSCNVLALGAANATAVPLTWSTPTIYARKTDGLDGVDGADGADGSAGVGARSVDLISTSSVITYNSSGTSPSPSSATITANANNTSNTAYYRFFLNDNAVGAASTSNTYAYTAPSNISGLPSKIEVELREGSGTSTVLARDQISIGGIKPGATGSNGSNGSSGSNGSDGLAGSDGVDAITTFYSNQAHTVPVTLAGAETWTGSGGVLKLYDGSTALSLETNSQSASYPSTNGRYRINITKVSGNTLGEPSITGAIGTTTTLGNFSGNLTTATVYRINVYVKSVSGVQYNPVFDIAIAPSFQGSAGSNGSNGSNGTNGTNGTNGAAGVGVASTAQSLGWVENENGILPPGTTQTATVTFFASSTINVTVTATRTSSTVSLSANTVSGTSKSFSGNGTTLAKATITHTASGVKYVVQAFLYDIDIGGVK